MRGWPPGRPLGKKWFAGQSHGGVDAGSSYASCRREPVGVTPYLLGVAGPPGRRRRAAEAAQSHFRPQRRKGLRSVLSTDHALKRIWLWKEWQRGIGCRAVVFIAQSGITKERYAKHVCPVRLVLHAM